MLDAIHTVVTEGITRTIPQTTPRNEPIPRLANRASVIKGVRRCGKTYRMFQHMNHLRESGVAREDMLFVDFEDDRLDSMSNNVIDDVVEQYLRATLGNDRKRYLFFDEVQNVSDWGRTLRRLTQDPRFEICVSGSSAKMLSEDVATEFRGRGIATELYPFSFREYLRFKDQEPSSIVSPDEARMLSSAFEDYLRIGGFPEIQATDTPTRITALQDVACTIAARDLAERHGLPMLGTRKFIQKALRLSGREFSVNKIYNDLRSIRVPLSKDEAYSMPEHCEDACLFFLVSRFGADAHEASHGKRKLYAIDPGLQFAFGPSSSTDMGQRLEDAVYLELKRMSKGDRLTSIGFYQTKKGYEIDFAVGDEDSRRISSLYQVSIRIDDEKTFERETRALSEALDETGLDRGFLIVLDSSKAPTPEDGRIAIVEAWRWMLNEETELYSV